MKRRDRQQPKTPQYPVPEHDPSNMALNVPRDWSPEQAAAVFGILDPLQGRIWDRYGPSIQHALWEKQMAPKAFSINDLDPGDVPF